MALLNSKAGRLLCGLSVDIRKACWSWNFLGDVLFFHTKELVYPVWRLLLATLGHARNELHSQGRLLTLTGQNQWLCVQCEGLLVVGCHELLCMLHTPALQDGRVACMVNNAQADARCWPRKLTCE